MPALLRQLYDLTDRSKSSMLVSSFLVCFSSSWLMSIPVDSIFSPVEAASYQVESARVGQNINLDKLTVTVKTNGTSSPKEVISLS